LKAVREKKQITYKGEPIKITADFSMETLKARRAWSEVLRALQDILPSKTIIQNRWSNKSIHNKQKLKQYMTISHHYKRFFKEFSFRKMKANKSHERTGKTKPQEKKRQGIKE
jgi:hypothetical protein